LLREPLAGVDGVELGVPKGVAGDLLARSLHLADDVLDTSALLGLNVRVCLLSRIRGKIRGKIGDLGFRQFSK
jgi:hypothetical protein